MMKRKMDEGSKETTRKENKRVRERGRDDGDGGEKRKERGEAVKGDARLKKTAMLTSSEKKEKKG